MVCGDRGWPRTAVTDGVHTHGGTWTCEVVWSFLWGTDREEECLAVCVRGEQTISTQADNAAIETV